MKGLILPLAITLALLATLGLVLVAFREQATNQQVPDPDASAGTNSRAPHTQPNNPAPAIRPYQTTATLAEDLRDALAREPDQLADECWRVSRALKTKARWTLLHVARGEASPRVRALLVIAAGVHVQDGDLVLASLGDRSAIVRRAAALAVGYVKTGRTRRRLLEGLEVPIGRKLSPRTEQALRRGLAKEKDAAVRTEIEAVLSR